MAEHSQPPGKNSESIPSNGDKAITVHLRPEIASELESLAGAKGFSVEQYVMQLLEELLLNAPEATHSEENGMVWEDSLLVYRTGNPLPTHVVTDSVRRSRDERLERILGDLT
jgi:hypothetical protein